MDIDKPRPKTLRFIAGPVEVVEETLATLPGEWIATQFFHHVIGERACVTVTLVHASVIRQMQLAQGVNGARPN